MPGIINRPTEEKEAGNGKAELHPVLLRLDDDDHDKLLHLCRLGNTNKNDILRQCIRHIYREEFGKAGAA